MRICRVQGIGYAKIILGPEDLWEDSVWLLSNPLRRL